MPTIPKLNRNNLIYILIISLPFSFTIGPALIEITSLIFLIIFLYFFVNKEKDFKELLNDNKNIIRLFILFWLILLLTSFLSENYFLSFKNTAFYFRFFVFSLIILYFLNKNQKIITLILYAYFVIFLILFLTSIYEYSTGLNFFSKLKPINGRITSIFLDEQVMGSFVSKSLPLIFALIYFINIKHKSVIFFLLLSVSLILISLSGERTALGLFLVFLIFLLKIKNFRKTILSISIIVLISLIIFPNIGNISSIQRISNHTLSQIGYQPIGDSERLRVFSPVHEHHYISGIKMFLENPLNGVGPNNFREECKKDKYHVTKIPFMSKDVFARDNGFYLGKFGKYFIFQVNNNIQSRHHQEININYKILDDDNSQNIRIPFNKGDNIFSYNDDTKINGCNTHPHNFLIQFAAETGILGLFFYIPLIFYLFYKICISYLSRNLNFYSEYFIIISILFYLFPLLPSGNFYNNYNSFIIFWNLPFYIYFRQNYIKKTIN